MEENSANPNQAQTSSRVRQVLLPSGVPNDDRGRMRMVVDSLILHLHPTKIPASTLRWTYTWGLGGLSALLVALLALTGVFLQMNYTPNPAHAYTDILNLRSDTWFGELLRNLHHWSANLLILVSVLHMLRVFFTGAYRQPRELNWILGMLMLLLVLAANFTGYLLPWDQLAFWAITVGTSILSYVPLVGGWMSRLLLGGPEVGAATLLNFYSLHISFIPIAILGLMSFHFWRVRKDGGLSLPLPAARNGRGLELEDSTNSSAANEQRKSVGDGVNPMVRVTTIPHLVRRELVWALLWLAILLTWAMLVPAPLEGIADPLISPNPAKAPWYFLGIQELLLHFHPLIGAIVIPGLALAALFTLPFIDLRMESVGVYFRSISGRYLTLMAVGLGLLITPVWVLLDEYLLDWSGWLTGLPTLVSNGLIPLALLLMGLWLLDRLMKLVLRASLEERILFLFVFLFTGFVVLTIVGIFFRGEGMMLAWPQ